VGWFALLLIQICGDDPVIRPISYRENNKNAFFPIYYFVCLGSIPDAAALGIDNAERILLKVSAVCNGLAAQIRALRGKDQGCKNVAEFWRGN
jgi:hypothetical protein